MVARRVVGDGCKKSGHAVMAVRRELWSVMAVRRVVSDGYKKSGQ